jgi:hypothetical protein
MSSGRDNWLESQARNQPYPQPSEVEKRLVRIESRLVRLMIHLGIDPYEKMYEQFDPHQARDRRAT